MSFRSSFRTCGCLGALVGAAMGLVAAVTPARAHKPGHVGDLAGFVEQMLAFRGETFKAPIRFPKWEDALNRFYSEPYPHGYRAFAHQWDAFLASIRKDGPGSQVWRVQQYVNYMGYVRDPPASTGADYWKSPAEFFAAAGDCEDYVIAKYWSLRKLGFAPDALRIIVVYARDARTAHAVLRVRVNGKLLLLDNLHDSLRPADRARNYVALYGVNERHAFLFPKRERLDSDVVYDRATPLSIFDIETGAGGGTPLRYGE